MFKRIMVAVDGSDSAELAIDAALQLAQAFSAKIRLVNVLDDSAWVAGYDAFGNGPSDLLATLVGWGEMVLRDATSRVRSANIEVESVHCDKPGQRLGETVAGQAKLWNADLIVLGTHGRKGFSRLLMGSGAEQIIRNAPVPVLVVRAPESASKPETVPSTSKDDR